MNIATVRGCIVVIVVLVFCTHAAAKPLECVTLSENDTVGLTLTAEGGFENCFSLMSTPADTDIVFMVSGPGISSKITLYDLGSSPKASYVTEHHKPASEAKAFVINTTDRTLGFVIQPESDVPSDKNVTITIVDVAGSRHVIISLENVSRTMPAE
mgnify:FL=1